MSSAQIAASILSADFARLGEQVAEAEEAGADWIHVDVMDGRFVPNLTLGPAVTAAVRRSTRLPLDVHLMVEEPERFARAFVDAGATSLTVHAEATRHLHRAVDAIRQLGARAGVAINPATPVEALSEIVPYVDLVLVMSVDPGFGGQSFLPTSVPKIRRARELLLAAGRPEVLLEVDGGLDERTVPEVAAAGATLLVAGSAIFDDRGNVAGNVQALRGASRR